MAPKHQWQDSLIADSCSGAQNYTDTNNFFPETLNLGYTLESSAKFLKTTNAQAVPPLSDILVYVAWGRAQELLPK